MPEAKSGNTVKVPVINDDGNYEGIIDKKILLQTLDRAG